MPFSRYRISRFFYVKKRKFGDPDGMVVLVALVALMALMTDVRMADGHGSPDGHCCPDGPGRSGGPNVPGSSGSPPASNMKQFTRSSLSH